MIPDVETAREEALEAAYALALREVIDSDIALSRNTHACVIDEAKRVLAKQHGEC